MGERPLSKKLSFDEHPDIGNNDLGRVSRKVKLEVAEVVTLSPHLFTRLDDDDPVCIKEFSFGFNHCLEVIYNVIV